MARLLLCTYILTISTLSHSVWSFTISTKGKEINVKAGQSLVFDCTVVGKDYTYTTSPVVWIKTQNFYEKRNIIKKEEFVINHASIIQDPFKPNMFKVDMVNVKGKDEVQFPIRISNVTAASAGTYTCCVREKTPQCKAYVSYIINIIEPLRDVVLTGVNPVTTTSTTTTTTAQPQNVTLPTRPTERPPFVMPPSPPGTLSYQEGMSGYFMCSATSGYPTPKVAVLIDNQVVESNSFYESVSRMSSGLPGYRVSAVTHSIWHNAYRPAYHNNGKTVECHASAIEDTRQLSAKLMVYFTPKFNCSEDQEITEGNNVISCTVLANPPASALNWTVRLLDGGLLEIPGNEERDRYATTASSTEDDIYRLDTTLRVKGLKNSEIPSVTQGIRITVENALGKRTFQINISRGVISSAVRWPSGSLLSGILATTILYFLCASK